MTPRAAAIHQPVLSGTRRVAGLWFDAERLPASVRAQRILATWRPGAQAFRFAEGDLLRFPADAIVHCAHAPGEALCRIDGDRLCSAPLAREERTALDDADLLLVRDARILRLRLRDGATLDPSQWIALDDAPLHDTFDFSDPPARMRIDALDGKAARRVFDRHVPGAAPEREGLLRAVKGIGRDSGVGGVGGASGAGRAGGMRPSGLSGWMAGLASKMAQALPPVAPGRTEPSRLRQTLTRLALASRLSSVIGRRQSAYLQRMLRHFDSGDLQEALRHAIPLNGDGASLGQAFSAPGRRDSLRLSQTLPGGTYRIHIQDELQQHLNQVYRQAFERLDREGRIEEAAFVLAELLNARQECLDYLERHDRAAQAAELALGWQMPSATSIRLLLLAGDWGRAVLLARRDDAFASLIPQLETKQPALASKMRVAWGEALADRGEWLAAVDAVWPVPQARTLAVAWLRTAERSGAELSARALVRRAALLPETLDDHRERILALSDPDTGADVRNAVAQALLSVSASSEALSEMALRILPALAADRAEGLNTLDHAQFKRLLSRAGDEALNADMPSWRMPSATATDRHWDKASASPLGIPAPGLVPIADAVPLPRQRYLVALGETGLVVIDRGGRVLQRYAEPCHRIVIADNGAIALAVAGREQVVRVTRIDLDRQHASDLGAIALQHFAPRFDGIGWSIVAEGRLLVLDAAKSLHDVLWHVGDLPGAVAASHYGVSHELHLIGNEPDWQLWSYSLPERRLISRDRVDATSDHRLLLVPPARCIEARVRQPEDGVVIVEYLGDDPSRHQELAWQAPPKSGIGSVSAQYTYSAPMRPVRARLALPATQTPTRIDLVHTAHGLWLAAGLADGTTTFGLHRHDNGLCVQQGVWPADTMPQLREHADGLLVFDAQGRLLDLSPLRATPVAISLLP